MTKPEAQGHTQLPWRAQNVWGTDEVEIVGPMGEEIALICESNGMDETVVYPAKANAAFIVEACNNYEQLKTLITGLLSPVEPGEDVGSMESITLTLYVGEIREVLKVARGGGCG